MPFTRREAIAASGGLLWLATFPALAQGYPSRTIKMIVPYPAGGTTDLLGRMRSAMQGAHHRPRRSVRESSGSLR